MTQIQDMDQPLADNPRTTEVSAMTSQAEPGQMKSGRGIKEIASYHRSFGLVAWETLSDQDEQEKFPSTITQYELQKIMDHPLAFAATTTLDILYTHEAMKAPDRKKVMKWKLTSLNMKQEATLYW